MRATSLSKEEIEAEENPFSDKMKKWWVKKYMVLRAAGKLKVRIYNEKYLSWEEWHLRQKPRPPKVYKTANERTFWETKMLDWRRKNTLKDSGSFYIERIPEKVPDRRFRDLPALEAKYKGEIPVSKKDWTQAEKKLYPLVMLLYREHRTEGDVELPPVRDLVEVQGLREKVEELQANYNKLKFDFDVMKAEARRQRWPV